MEKWTREELEELYKKINDHLKNDPAFNAAMKEDFGAAVMKLAGRELPKGFKLNVVTGEAGHEASLSLPDFTTDELDMKDLATVPGGALPGRISIEELCVALKASECVTYWCYQDLNQPYVDPNTCPMYDVCAADAIPSGSCTLNICAAEEHFPANPCALEAPIK